METILEVAAAVIAHNIKIGYVSEDDLARQRFQELRAAVVDQNQERCRALLTRALENAEKTFQEYRYEARDPRLQVLMDRAYVALGGSQA